MSINIIKLLFVPFISLFIIVSSISLGKDASLGLMIFTGLSLSISLALDRKYPRLKVFQFIFLGAFHFVSNLNWCILLYYIVIINLIQDKEKFKETMPVAFLLVMGLTGHAFRINIVPDSVHIAGPTTYNFADVLTRGLKNMSR